MPLVRSILHASGTDSDEKASLIIVDPKNEFGPFIADLLRAVGREDDLVILKLGASYYNPLESPFLTQNEVVEKIIGWANNTHRDATRRARGDEAYWANALRSALSAVIAATRTIHRGKLTFSLLNETFRTINRFANATAAKDWMNQHQFADSTVEGIRDYLALPKTRRAPVWRPHSPTPSIFGKASP